MKSAARRIHPSEPARQPATLRQRIVAAGVEDDDVDAVARLVHRAQHLVGIDRLGLEVLLACEIGVDWDQVIVAVRLNAVPA